MIEVLNKIDLVAEDERGPMGCAGERCGLGAEEDRAWRSCWQRSIDALVADPVIEVKFRLPQSEGAVLAALEAGAILDEKRFEGNLALCDGAGTGFAAQSVQQVSGASVRKVLN